MLILSSSCIIILCSMTGIISNKNNFLFFVLYMEVILICITFIFSFMFYSQGSYFGQMYGLFMLTMAAIESAMMMSLMVQFYSYSGTMGVNVVNYGAKM